MTLAAICWIRVGQRAGSVRGAPTATRSFLSHPASTSRSPMRSTVGARQSHVERLKLPGEVGSDTVVAVEGIVDVHRRTTRSGYSRLPDAADRAAGSASA